MRQQSGASAFDSLAKDDLHVRHCLIVLSANSNADCDLTMKHSIEFLNANGILK